MFFFVLCCRLFFSFSLIPSFSLILVPSFFSFFSCILIYDFDPDDRFFLVSNEDMIDSSGLIGDPGVLVGSESVLEKKSDPD